MMVLGGQARQVADEMLSKTELGTSSRVLVFVEGGEHPTIIENALLDGIQKRGGIGSVVYDQRMPGLHVVILQQTVQYRTLGENLFERVVRTTTEGRWTGEGSETVFLGQFARMGIDTVAMLESSRVDTKGSWFERVLGPVVIITGTIVAVYLLFTVRS